MPIKTRGRTGTRALYSDAAAAVSLAGLESPPVLADGGAHRIRVDLQENTAQAAGREPVTQRGVTSSGHFSVSLGSASDMPAGPGKLGGEQFSSERSQPRRVAPSHSRPSTLQDALGKHSVCKPPGVPVMSRVTRCFIFSPCDRPSYCRHPATPGSQL